jgi:fumarate reductase flavoprotein subunit
VHCAPSIEALAGKAGLPTATLLDEVAAYNAAIQSARSEMLSPGRNTHKFPALAIATAPFYAIPVAPGITYTMGGIRIDAYSRVLDSAGTHIPGIYAAGSAVGGIEGGPHAGYVGGLCKAGVTAMRAADHILAQDGERNPVAASRRSA